MFFDLNIREEASARDHSRRECVAMCMQLGYTAIATAHIVSGVMQETDKCKIQPLKLDAILSASPEVQKSALLHRRLLNVPPNSPFRQYTRITVVVDDQVQAASLNSANPVLQTYDIVAVQPMNQKMFAQACTQMEVDIISLNMCQKLAFKIKSSLLIKAAIERGIYFEIIYGPALSDTKARKELFANTQMLVTASRGRNIILSSGARQAFEIRGPNDVANMSTLFGLTIEQAKGAISKNCNSGLLRGYARRNTYKAAIALDSSQAEFEVPTGWDPLSTPDEYVLPENDLSTSNTSSETVRNMGGVVAKTKSAELVEKRKRKKTAAAELARKKKSS